MDDMISFGVLFIMPIVLGYVIHKLIEYDWADWAEAQAEMGESTYRWMNGERY